MRDDSPAVNYRWSIIELLSNSVKAGTIIMVFTCTGSSEIVAYESALLFSTLNIILFVHLLVIGRQLRKRNPFQDR